MTVIIDYGVGNLYSLKSSFEYIGEKAFVSSVPSEILSADRIILPGVGAFGDAADKLARSGLDLTVKTAAQNGIPLLGICLGMQLLFDRSFEFGEHKGLGLIRGEIRAFKPMINGLKVPHIGWNKLNFPKTREVSRLFNYVEENSSVYFVHSFAAFDCEAATTATTEYGIDLTAAVENGNVYGTQFHPEKSGRVGLSILRSFLEIPKG